MEHHDLLAGFIRLHVLHHAAEHEIYGQWMIDELASHGYRLSPGTLYPMLHTMEQRGYLTSRVERTGRSTRKFYRATEFGLQGLAIAKVRVREFTGEVLGPAPSVSAPSVPAPSGEVAGERRTAPRNRG